jgi:CheY-like chemotaxis protein
MDCQMPVMDGWEATRELRKLMLKNEMPIIPIVGLTAFTSSSDISECFRSGMTEVLHKPLDIA